MIIVFNSIIPWRLDNMALELDDKEWFRVVVRACVRALFSSVSPLKRGADIYCC